VSGCDISHAAAAAAAAISLAERALAKSDVAAPFSGRSRAPGLAGWRAGGQNGAVGGWTARCKSSKAD